MERRLAAILAADVLAYSRIMGEDEDQSETTIDAHHSPARLVRISFA